MSWPMTLAGSPVMIDLSSNPDGMPPDAPSTIMSAPVRDGEHGSSPPGINVIRNARLLEKSAPGVTTVRSPVAGRSKYQPPDPLPVAGTGFDVIVRSPEGATLSVCAV